MNQLLENGKNPNFRTDFGPFMQFQGKCVWSKLKKSQKPHFGSDLGALGPYSGRHSFFFKNLASSVTRYGQLSSCTISEKTNDPILKKFNDGRTDRQIDGREWFYRTLSG